VLCLEKVEDPVVVDGPAVRVEVEISVCFREISAANEPFAFEQRCLELQLFRTTLLRNRLDALVVVRFTQDIAFRLPLVGKVHKTV